MRSSNVLKFGPAKHFVFRMRLSQAAAAIRSRARRTHGGAVPGDYLVQGGSSSAQRNGSRIAEKTRIAQCASELIEDGDSVRDSVILNGGSTTRLFVFELGGKKDLTVVTNFPSIRYQNWLASVHAGKHRQKLTTV
jgi:hypothetical protein